MGDRGKVAAVLADYKTAPISEHEKALFRFIQKLNRKAWEIRQGDVDELHQAGWTDEAIYDAINVCCLFNFYNRWIDASGVHEMSEEGHRQAGVRIAQRGYSF